MSLQDAQDEESLVILIITPQEAQYGGIHMLMPPDGHAVMVTIPANTRENDEIRLPGQGSAGKHDAIPADLVVRIMFSSSDTNVAPASPADPITPPESTLLFANPRLTSFPLIIPETPDSFEQPVPLADTFAASPSQVPSQASQFKFPRPSATPIPLDASAAVPASDEASYFASELPTTPVPAVPALLAETPATPIDGETLTLNSVTPDTSLANTDQPAIDAGSLHIPASSEIVLSDNIQSGNLLNPPVLPGTSAASAPSQLILLAQPRRKRLDAMAILSLCAALLLLLLSIGVVVFSFGYYQPAQAQASATATANVIPTATLYAFQTQIAGEAQTTAAQQTATVTTYQNIYTQALSTRPFINDSLKQPSNSAWDEGSLSDNASCAFHHGSYEVYEPDTKYFMPCFAENSFFTNFAVQVTMNIRHGDEGGVFLRGSSQYGGGYLFQINEDGYYEIYSYTNKIKQVLEGKTYNYQSGQANQLTLIVTGTTFYIYLNKKYLDTATDRTFGEGQIALIASNYQDSTTVDYNNFKVWLLP